MKKKVAIVTPYGNNNFGNKLQNYALQYVLENLGFEVITLKNNIYSNTKKFYLLRCLKNKLKKERIKNDRTLLFENFNKNINYSKEYYNAFSKYKDFDYVVCGSDQIWNPNQGRLRDFDLLSEVPSQKRISYAASFGIDEIPLKYIDSVRKELGKFKAISVREDRGNEIVKEITGRNDTMVLLDPTLLLPEDAWNKIMVKPEKLKSKKYILNYFLGTPSEKIMKEIKKVAEQNGCDIINLMDEDDTLFNSGPSEFLYLEKNAFLICTDSFHSSVFAFIFNKPFIVFERNQSSLKSMNSRIETLINKLNLKDRKFNGKEITTNNLNHNYVDGYHILEEEKNKSIDFFKKNMN